MVVEIRNFNRLSSAIMHNMTLYDFHAGQHNPLTGRFMTMDPHAESYYSISPYTYCLNNPVKYVDPDGEVPLLAPLLIAGGKALVGAAVDAAAQITVSMANGQSFQESLSNIDYTSVGASAAASALTAPGMSTVAKLITGAAIVGDALVDVSSGGGVESVITGEKSLGNVAIDVASSVIPGKIVDGVTSSFNKAITSDLTATSAATMTKETKSILSQTQTTVNSTTVQTGIGAVSDYTGGIIGGQANEELNKK